MGNTSWQRLMEHAWETSSMVLTSINFTHKGQEGSMPELTCTYGNFIFDRRLAPKSVLVSQMDFKPNNYFGFTDGASRWSQNLAAAAWVIYYLDQSPFFTNGVWIELATKNQAEYDTVIGLMSDAFNQSIYHLHIYLDSQLVFL